MTRPTLIKFYLEPNDDEEITCLFCGHRKCEQSFMAGGGGRKNIYGVHNDCAENHMSKLLPLKP